MSSAHSCRYEWFLIRAIFFSLDVFSFYFLFSFVFIFIFESEIRVLNVVRTRRNQASKAVKMKAIKSSTSSTSSTRLVSPTNDRQEFIPGEQAS